DVVFQEDKAWQWDDTSTSVADGEGRYCVTFTIEDEAIDQSVNMQMQQEAATSAQPPNTPASTHDDLGDDSGQVQSPLAAKSCDSNGFTSNFSNH
ncbi:hypothetical protein E2562_021357, partial [Oryza meyeriana var. granulata]